MENKPKITLEELAEAAKKQLSEDQYEWWLSFMEELLPNHRDVRKRLSEILYKN